MANRTNNNNGTNNPYGHLLDKYMDNTHENFSTQKEREEEARSKYGHLLDYAKPNNKFYEDIIALDETCRNIRQQRAEEYAQANIRRQERRERERRNRQEQIDRNNAFVDSILEKKEAERKAAEQKRKEEEREQNMLNTLQRVINVRDEMSEKIARTNAMLQGNEQRRKEHEEKMAWYESQHR